MEKADIELVRKRLFELAEVGLELTERLVEKYNKPFKGGPRHGVSHMKIDGLWVPSEVGLAAVQTDPPLFRLQNMQAFWILFDQAVKNLEAPIVQMTLRAMLELGCARIIGHACLPKEEQRVRAVKYWLCIMGLLYPEHPFSGLKMDRGALYDSLTGMLGIDPERAGFETRRAKSDYVFFHKAMHEAIPSLLDRRFASKIQKFVDEALKLPLPKQDYLEWCNRSLSMAVHGNPTSIIQFKADEKTYNHVLRVGKIMSQIGCIVAAYAQFDAGIGPPGSGKLYELEIQIRAELGHLWAQRNRDGAR